MATEFRSEMIKKFWKGIAVKVAHNSVNSMPLRTVHLEAQLSKRYFSITEYDTVIYKDKAMQCHRRTL